MVTTNHPTDVTGLLGGATGTWALDPSATTIELHTKAMWGLVKVKANFNALSGSATVTAGAVNGALVIDAASVNSGNKKRDAHLRTPTSSMSAVTPPLLTPSPPPAPPSKTSSS